MLFGPTDLFGFKLEMMLEIPFLLIGDKKNDLKDLFSMYSEKCFYVNNLHGEYSLYHEKFEYHSHENF